MHNGDVDDDGRQNGQRERDEAINQQRSAGEQVRHKQQREKISAGGKSADELRRLSLTRWQRNDMQETVQTEAEEHPPEKEARSKERVRDRAPNPTTVELSR